MPSLLWSNAKVVVVPSSKGMSKGPTGKFRSTLGMFIIWVTPGGPNFISMWCSQWVLDEQPCAANVPQIYLITSLATTALLLKIIWVTSLEPKFGKRLGTPSSVWVLWLLILVLMKPQTKLVLQLALLLVWVFYSTRGTCPSPLPLMDWRR